MVFCGYSKGFIGLSKGFSYVSGRFVLPLERLSLLIASQLPKNIVHVSCFSFTDE